MNFIDEEEFRKVKRNYKTLSASDRVFRDGNVYFISLRLTNVVGKYTISVFDEQHKYKFEIVNVTSFDFRMLRKTYPNVYYLSEEINELSARF